MILKKYFRRKFFAKELAFLTHNKAKLCKFWIVTLDLEKKRLFCRRKLAKIAENCDHNIDPRFFILCENDLPEVGSVS
jgi:hypothetical protein